MGDGRRLVWQSWPWGGNHVIRMKSRPVTPPPHRSVRLRDDVTRRFPECLSVWEPEGQWRSTAVSIDYGQSKVVLLVHADRRRRGNRSRPSSRRIARSSSGNPILRENARLVAAVVPGRSDPEDRRSSLRLSVHVSGVSKRGSQGQLLERRELGWQVAPVPAEAVGAADRT